MLFQASKLPASKRAAVANKIRTIKDIELPELEYFNSSPCDKHESLNPTCQQCGVIFRKHQRIGVAWLYTAKKGLLADSVGTGKTIQAAGTAAVIKQAGELNNGERILIVCRPSAVSQWEVQLNRLLKDVKIIVGDGIKKKRNDKYQSDWEICIINPIIMINDLEALDNAFEFQAVFSDDIDALRNSDTATSYAFNRLSRHSPHIYILTGTPLQKRLQDIYNVLQPLNIRQVLGSPTTFERRHIRKELVNVVSTSGAISTQRKVVGYRNLSEFKEKIAPFTLRRTAADIDDVDLPAVVPSNVFLEPYRAQVEKYKELQRGVLRIIKDQGEEVKRATAIAKFLYGAQICGGLAVLGEPDREQTSVKLDWVEEKLVDGDLSDEKVVVFINFKNGVRALQNRLSRNGVGFATIWGETKGNTARFEEQQRFWNDSDCRVLIGTTSIEQSLNLQIARHLINVDMIMNPSRMEQLAGRIRRDGSTHHTVYVHNLLTVGTQEERYLPALEREQALIDHVWDSKSELFDALSPLEMLAMIGGTGI